MPYLSPVKLAEIWDAKPIPNIGFKVTVFAFFSSCL
jgi:hypothetical protein